MRRTLETRPAAGNRGVPRGLHYDPCMESDERARYDELIAREAAHWGAAKHDPDNPQLWDEPELRALALDPNLQRLIDRVAAAGSPALELGCGEGDLSLAIARRGVEIMGIDLSEA